MPPTSPARLPQLPALVKSKLYKVNQTRGATPTEIYQNRVLRNNTVLIFRKSWELCRKPDDGSNGYENGFIVLVEPSWYFTTHGPDAVLAAQGLALGKNALLLFQRKTDWTAYGEGRKQLPNRQKFEPAVSRSAPLGGVYIARVHGTTSVAGSVVSEGYNTTSPRGAGIRVYEYASKLTITQVELQLEALMWLADGSVDDMVKAEMTRSDAVIRRRSVLHRADHAGLLNLNRLEQLRAINSDHQPVCPLCLEPISAASFLDRTIQPEGREVHDLTTTDVSLFHVQELRVGRLQHRAYNLAWGHHYCNVVVKDAGIFPTLSWMQGVIKNNEGHMDEASVEKAVDG